jgi:heme A synthase
MNELTKQRANENHGSRGPDGAVCRIRVLAVATMITTYFLIVLGSTVRVTNSGMGCSSWPLCNGRVSPIDQFHPLMEQSHRYLATIVTILIALLAVLVWRAGPNARHVRKLALVSVGVIVVQIVLGAITVLTNNAPATVALHLIVGLLFLAIVTVTAVASFIDPEESWSLFQRGDRLAWASVVGLFFVLISGSLVVDGGAQSACKSWPACFGSLASAGLVTLQYLHRSLVFIGALLVVIYLVTLWRRRSSLQAQHVLALCGLVLLAAQIIVGAFDALLGAPTTLADVHLTLASALWAVVIGVVALSSRGTRTQSLSIGSDDAQKRTPSNADRKDP